MPEPIDKVAATAAVAVLNAYRDARVDLHSAVVAAADAGVPRYVIAYESGLSREWIRQILERERRKGKTEYVN